MRRFRFVRFLGDHVEAASREVAATATDTLSPDEQLPSAEVDPHAGVRRDLPRTIASELDGISKGPIAMSGVTVTVDDREPSPTDTTPDLGVVIQTSLPDFDNTNAFVAKTVDARALTDPESSLAEAHESEALGRLLDITADSFVFVVGERFVEAVPAQTIASVTDPAKRERPHAELYARRLGRTFEEAAEGFIGDGSIAPEIAPTSDRASFESRLHDWGAKYELRQVLGIRIEATEPEEAATLQDFLD